MKKLFLYPLLFGVFLLNVAGTCCADDPDVVSIAKNDGFRQTRALDYAFRRFPNIERQLSEGTHVSFIDKEGQEAYRTRTLARALRLAASDHTTAA